MITRLTHAALRTYCLSKPGTSEDFPFDATTCVYRVMGRIFALTNVLSEPVQVNLKCDPDWALILRQHYAAVQPGYHMHKRHWNTVTLDGSVPEAEVWEMIDHSYRLVVASLPKAVRAQLTAGDVGQA